jgi:hypothetical protein
MATIHESLRQIPGIRGGDTLFAVTPHVDDPRSLSPVRWVNARQVHEFSMVAVDSVEPPSPLTFLTAMAMELAPHASIAWVGRECWPTFQHLVRPDAGGDVGLMRHIFLDPLSEAERLWALLEVVRCPAVRVVVAEGRGMNSIAGRRLQLAAETGNAVVLLIRPASEWSKPSWAKTRWRVRSAASSTGQPRWEIALARASGARQGQDASRHSFVSWTYEVFRGSGTLNFSPAVGCGTGTAATTGEASSHKRQTA